MRDIVVRHQLAKRLADLRMKRNLTQLQLANAIGKGLVEVQYLESGISNTAIIDLLRVAAALNVTVDDIFEGIEEVR